MFGNSNSLPISLVISLASTLKGLHWDKVPNDNDDEVAARGILYLLIFQQLGQLLRWSWGYNVLLAPAEKYVEEGDSGDRSPERGRMERYTDDPEENENDLMIGAIYDGEDARPQSEEGNESNDTGFDSGGQTPVTYRRHASTKSSRSSSRARQLKSDAQREIIPPANGNMLTLHPSSNGHIISFPTVDSSRDEGTAGGISSFTRHAKQKAISYSSMLKNFLSQYGTRLLENLPPSVQKVLSKLWAGLSRFMSGLWAFMNPPLWAMLVAIIVASIPPLQRAFFQEGTFIRNSVTRAVAQSGGVAVPLIFGVLCAHLANHSLP